MKHLLTLAALFVSTLSLAQFTPYNPDADNDQFVGAQDLLAFLPLFGEDWDLDSLTIYPASELLPPSWCDLPGNGNACTQYLVVPQDADIIYCDLEVDYGKFLVLPEVPKPMIIFNATDTPSWDFNTVNTEEGETLIQAFSYIVRYEYGKNFAILTGFGGNWFLNR